MPHLATETQGRSHSTLYFRRPTKAFDLLYYDVLYCCKSPA